MFDKLKEIIANQNEWLQKPLTDPWYEHEFCAVLEDELYMNLDDTDIINSVCFTLRNGTVNNIEIWLWGEDSEGNQDKYSLTPYELKICIVGGKGKCDFYNEELAEALIELEGLLQQLYPLLNKIYGPALKAEDDDYIVEVEMV